MADLENNKFLTVRYMLDAREQKALEELLPFFQNYISPMDGSRPFADWTIENAFQAVMELGFRYVVAQKIQEMQIRQGLIEWDERLENGFKTMEERRAYGTGRADTGAGKAETSRS